VVDNEGHIVTNTMSSKNAMTIQVAFVDGTLVDAELIGTDPQADLAVIKVDPSQWRSSP